MQQISLNITSISLNCSTISQIKSTDMIKLNVTQKPIKSKQEYIINHLQGLNNINHEFKIVFSPNNMKYITLSIRKVEKKWCLENLFKFYFTKSESRKDLPIDSYTRESNEKFDPNIQYEYEQLANSLLGFCKIGIENLEKGVNNCIKADILNKKDSKTIGHADIEIYIWNDENNIQYQTQKSDDLHLNTQIIEESLSDAANGE